MDIIKNISIIFISIFFESLPFLLLGSFISAVIENYVSNETISKMIPKNKILGSIVGVFLGFFIPACDCAVIPVSKRLLKKKVPINVAISFMLSSPIINPVVLLSTYYAFYRTNPNIFFLRIILGIVISLVIGVIMGVIFKDKDVVLPGVSDECSECCHDEDHHHDEKGFSAILRHTAYDLFDVVKYLMFGALIASLVQVLIPRSILTLFNNNQILSIVVLMLFAYLISLCSTSDSFVGKSLLVNFSEGSIIAYLLLGPMIDIKNTMVLLGNYQKKFVITLITLIFIVIFMATLLEVMVL